MNNILGTSKLKKIGLFAGTFDPFTLGHLDIVQQAKNDFNSVIIGVARNRPDKLRKYDRELMKYAIEKSIADTDLQNVNCVVNNSSTGEEALLLGCSSLIRGIRNKEDMIYEQKFADYNKHHFNLNTVFYMSPEHLKNVSSSKVKELLCSNQAIDNLVPRAIYELIKEGL